MGPLDETQNNVTTNSNNVTEMQQTTPPIQTDNVFSAGATPNMEPQPTEVPLAEMQIQNVNEIAANTAATIEAPIPQVEQQVALNVNAEEIFEGGNPITDEVTRLVTEVVQQELMPGQTISTEPIQASVVPEVGITPVVESTQVVTPVNPSVSASAVAPVAPAPTPVVEPTPTVAPAAPVVEATPVAPAAPVVDVPPIVEQNIVEPSIKLNPNLDEEVPLVEQQIKDEKVEDIVSPEEAVIPSEIIASQNTIVESSLPVQEEVEKTMEETDIPGIVEIKQSEPTINEEETQIVTETPNIAPAPIVETSSEENNLTVPIIEETIQELYLGDNNQPVVESPVTETQPIEQPVTPTTIVEPAPVAPVAPAAPVVEATPVAPAPTPVIVETPNVEIQPVVEQPVAPAAPVVEATSVVPVPTPVAVETPIVEPQPVVEQPVAQTTVVEPTPAPTPVAPVAPAAPVVETTPVSPAPTPVVVETPIVEPKQVVELPVTEPQQVVEQPSVEPTINIQTEQVPTQIKEAILENPAVLIAENGDTKFCDNCGIMLTEETSICPSCGNPID